MTEERIVDPKTGGMKGQKDERFDLIPWRALAELARVYGKGAKKYDDHNWLKGYRWSLSFGALMRHVALWAVGKDLDDETGLHHLAHAAWHCMTLMTFSGEGLGTDDRMHRVLEANAIKRREVEGQPAKDVWPGDTSPGDVFDVELSSEELSAINDAVADCAMEGHEPGNEVNFEQVWGKAWRARRQLAMRAMSRLLEKQT
jgi:hypothetical protein